MAESCANCKFWQASGTAGSCRRYPKRAVALGERIDSVPWPATVATEWCGEWKAAFAESPKTSSLLLYEVDTDKFHELKHSDSNTCRFKLGEPQKIGGWMI